MGLRRKLIAYLERAVGDSTGMVREAVELVEIIAKAPWEILAELRAAAKRRPQRARPRPKVEPPKIDRRIQSWSYFLPRKLREFIVGEVYEDIVEMRAAGFSER